MLRMRTSIVMLTVASLHFKASAAVSIYSLRVGTLLGASRKPLLRTIVPSALQNNVCVFSTRISVATFSNSSTHRNISFAFHLP